MDVCELSKIHFGETKNIKEAGYILKDGVMLDFSGRHESTGYEDKKPKPGQPDYLKGSRNVDHREVKNIFPERLTSPPEQSGTQEMIKFMKDCKAIRIAGTNDLNLNFIRDITPEQEGVLKNFEGRTAYVDIDDLNGRTVCSKDFADFNITGLKKEINKCQKFIHPEGHIIIKNE